jgi:hypothetical protein
VRRPFPPGGSANFISDWHFGQVGRSAFVMAFHPSLNGRRPIIYFALWPCQQEMGPGNGQKNAQHRSSTAQIGTVASALRYLAKALMTFVVMAVSQAKRQLHQP